MGRLYRLIHLKSKGFLLFAALLVLVFLLLEYGGGKRWLLSAALNKGLRGQGYELSLGPVKGSLFSKLRVEDFTLKQQDLLIARGKDLSLEWKPGQILDLKVLVKKIHLSELSLYSIPKSQRSDFDLATVFEWVKSVSMPSLPVGIALEELSVDRFVLGHPFADPELAFRLETEGFYKKEGDEASLSVALQRDQTDAFADAQIYWNTDENTLDLEVHALVEEDPAFSDFLGLEAQESANLTIEGGGSLEQLSFVGTMTLGEEVETFLTLDVGGKEAVKTVELSGYSVGNTFLPSAYQPLFSEEVFITGKASIDEASSILIENFDLLGKGWSVSVLGERPKLTLPWQTHFKVHFNDLGVLTSLGALEGQGAFDLDGTLIGADFGAVGNLSFVLDHLEIEDTKAEKVEGKLEILGEGETFNLEVSLLDIRSPSLPAELLSDLNKKPLHLKAEGVLSKEHKLPEVVQATLELDNLSLTSRLDASFDNPRSWAISGFGRLDQLGNLSLLKDALEGRVLFDTQGQITLGDNYALETFDLKAHSVIQEGAANQKILDDLLNRQPEFSMGIGYAEQRFDIKEFSVNTAALALDIQQDEENNLKYTVDFAAEDLAQLPQGLSNGFSGFAIASGEVSLLEGTGLLDAMNRWKKQDFKGVPKLKASGELASGEIRFGDEVFKNLQVNIETEQAGAGEPVQLSLEMLYRDLPVSLRAQLAPSQTQGIDLTNIDLIYGSNKAVGNLSVVSSQGAPLQGVLSLDIQNFQDIPFFDVFSGTADLDVSFSGTDRQEADLNLQTPLWGISAVEFEEVSAKGHIDDLFAFEGLSIDGFSQKFLGQIEQADIQIKGQTWDQLTGELEGQFQGSPLQTTLDFSRNDDAYLVGFQSLEGRMGGQDLRLASSTQLRIERGSSNLDLSPFSVSLEPLGEIKGQGSLKGGQVDLDFALANITAQTLSRTTGLTFYKGQLDGTLGIKGTLSEPQVTYEMDLTNLESSLESKFYLPPLSGTLKGGYKTNKLEGIATLLVDGKENLVLNLNNDARFSLSPFEFHIGREGEPFSLNVDARYDLSKVSDFIDLSVLDMEGQLHVAGQIRQEGQSTLFAGTLKSQDAYLEFLPLGLVIDQVSLNLATNPQGRIEGTLSGTDQHTGRFEGALSFSQSAAEGFPYKVTINAQNALLATQDFLAAKGSGVVEFSGGANQAALLSGNLTLQESEVRLIENNDVEITDLEVIELNKPAYLSDEITDETLRNLPLKFDLAIKAKDQLFFRGFGIESEWGLDLALKGDVQSPQLEGRAELIEGRASVIGQPFVFRTGVIDFTGHPYNDPSIYVQLLNRRGGIVGFVDVTGTAKNVEVVLRSEPELPQDEIIARLLFNQSAVDLSPIQAVQLALAVEDLQAFGRRQSVLGTIRRLTGVDQIDVRGNSNNDIILSAGKYLTDKLFVRGEFNTVSGGLLGGVEYELMDRVQLQAQVGRVDKQNDLNVTRDLEELRKGLIDVEVIWRRDY